MLQKPPCLATNSASIYDIYVIWVFVTVSVPIKLPEETTKESIKFTDKNKQIIHHHRDDRHNIERNKEKETRN